MVTSLRGIRVSHTGLDARNRCASHVQIQGHLFTQGPVEFRQNVAGIGILGYLANEETPDPPRTLGIGLR